MTGAVVNAINLYLESLVGGKTSVADFDCLGVIVPPQLLL